MEQRGSVGVTNLKDLGQEQAGEVVLQLDKEQGELGLGRQLLRVLEVLGQKEGQEMEHLLADATDCFDVPVSLELVSHEV